MAFFKKSKKQRPPTGPAMVGLYGKHPACGDFLRQNASSAEVQQLDRWLSSALDSGPRLLPSWDQDYSAVLSISFLFHDHNQPNNPWSLLGVLVPSQDASGRRFPLVIFAQVSRGLAAQHYDVIPHEPFVEQALRLLQRRNALSRDELIREVQALRPPDAESLRVARQSHETYLQQTQWIAAFSTMFGLSAPVQQGKAVGTLRQTVAGLSTDRSLPRYGLRFPLGLAPGGNAGLWLGLVKQAAPLALCPELLWTPRSMLLYFAQTSAKALAALLSPQWQHDTICDLNTATSGEEHALLPEPDQPLQAFLRQGS